MTNTGSSKKNSTQWLNFKKWLKFKKVTQVQKCVCQTYITITITNLFFWLWRNWKSLCNRFKDQNFSLFLPRVERKFFFGLCYLCFLQFFEVFFFCCLKLERKNLEKVNFRLSKCFNVPLIVLRSTVKLSNRTVVSLSLSLSLSLVKRRVFSVSVIVTLSVTQVHGMSFLNFSSFLSLL